MFPLFQSLNCRPIASLDHFVPEALGSAELVEEIHTGPSKIVKVRSRSTQQLTLVHLATLIIFLYRGITFNDNQMIIP